MTGNFSEITPKGTRTGLANGYRSAFIARNSVLWSYIEDKRLERPNKDQVWASGLPAMQATRSVRATEWMQSQASQRPHLMCVGRKTISAFELALVAILVNHHCDHNDQALDDVLDIRVHPTKVNPLAITPRISAPITVPVMRPIPPARLVPPITAAAIASSS